MAVFTGSGSAASPSITFSADTNTGIFSPGADQVAISTNGTNRLHISDTGNVGIGTTSPSGKLTVVSAVTGGTNYTNEQVSIFNSQTGVSGNQATLGFHLNNTNWGSETTFARVSAVLENGTTGATALAFGTATDGSLSTPNERVRIDSSGRLLVGTSTARSNFNNNSIGAETSPLQIEGLTASTAGAAFIHSGANILPSVLQFAKQRSGAVGGNTIVQSNDFVGFISFEGNDGSEFVRCASIAAHVDGTPGANDMPGRLVFSTTADGAVSPTERMRITSGGNLLIGGTLPSSPNISLNANGNITNSGQSVNGLQVFGLTKLAGTTPTLITLTFGAHAVAFIDIVQAITGGGSSAEYRLVAANREGGKTIIFIQQGDASASFTGNVLTITIPHRGASGNTLKFASVRGQGLSNPTI